MAAVGNEVAAMKEGNNYNTNGTNGAGLSNLTHTESMLPAHGGAFMPGPYSKTQFRQFANPAPLGLCGFALTTFILSLINVQSRGVGVASIVVGCAYAYGGLVQLLAGMWEMAVGNTFGATALSSYGGFWISFAIIESGGQQDYGLVTAYSPTTAEGAKHLQSALGFYLMGWWIFTTILLFCTLRSTVAFFLLFFTLDLAFLCLAIARFETVGSGASTSLNPKINKAGGIFGLMAAFLAWYNALAGLLDGKNSFFTVPVVHFPWSETGKQNRRSSVQASAA